jgi:hypothetical protein
MSKSTVISGQVFGAVDWVTDDNRELGMFLRASGRQTRCVLNGPAVEQFIANSQVKKGSVVTGYGDLHARVIKRGGKLEPELIVEALRLDVEAQRDSRPRGAIYAQLKSVVMFWDEKTYQMKSFLNSKMPGRVERLACSLYMNNWIAGMPDVQREIFVSSLRVGREYTAAANVEADCYSSQGVDVPVLRLLPTDFKLQD